MNNPEQLLVFALDVYHYALSLSVVERAVRIVEITPLPKAPGIVMGVINFHGQIIPVLNIRKRFRLPERDIGLSDLLLIARTSRRIVALVVGDVFGVVEYSAHEMIASPSIIAGLEYLSGVVKLADDMLFIHNLDQFLSIEEEEALEMAITKGIDDQQD